MNYVKDDQVFTELDIRAAHPTVSFPAAMEPRHVTDFGYHPIEATVPTFDRSVQTAHEGSPTLVDGEWKQTWVITNKPVEEIQSMLAAGVQQHLDNFARTRGYESMLSACTYATSTNSRFAPEGQYCVAARDDTWAMCYQILEEVQQGLRPTPTLNELLAMLPALVWPL